MIETQPELGQDIWRPEPRTPCVDAKILLQKPAKLGWVEMPEELYHADRTAVNYSSLKAMTKSPWNFYNRFFLNKPVIPTKAMKFGTLAHMAILQGSKFKEKYVVMPEFWGYTQKGERTNSANCKEVREARARWEADLGPGKLIVTEEERYNLVNMIDSILTHPKACRLLTEGIAEPIGYYVDPVTGIAGRVHPDFINTKYKALIEVKTTQDCTESEFMRDVYQRHLMYHMQIAAYDYGSQIIMDMEFENRAWLVIETSGSFECAVHEASPQTLAHGKNEYREAMNRLKICIEQGAWPRYEPVEGPAEAPSYWTKYYEERGVTGED